MQKSIIDLIDQAALSLNYLLDPDYVVGTSYYNQMRHEIEVYCSSQTSDQKVIINIKVQQDGRVTLSSGSRLRTEYQPETMNRGSRTFWTSILARALNTLGIK